MFRASERVDPKEVEVRLIRPQERMQWRALMARHHYLGDGRLVGECLRYVAEWRGQWLALSGWSSASMKSRLREAYVGWDEQMRLQRLHLAANHARYLILPGVRVPNLASCILAKNVKRLGQDWCRLYGHPIVLVETFVDLERFSGSCYRAANWMYLGQTRGHGRKGGGYEEHGMPKGMFVYALDRHAQEKLCAPLKCESHEQEDELMNLNLAALPIEGKGGLMDLLEEIPDPRKRRGVRHPFKAVLGVAICAALSGAKSFLSIAEYADDLDWETLKRFGFWVKDWGAPSEPTIRRVLQAMDAPLLDKKIGAWVQGLSDLRGKGIALDGKTLRGSSDKDIPAVHLLSAVVHEEGIVLGQVRVDSKTNEIKAFQPILEDMDIEGSVITADALHTQKEAARYVVEEKKADYVFIAKDNQPTLRQDIEALEWGAFSP
jgi:hypothetical protein